MKVICAWCNKEMEDEDGQDEMRYSVCRDCLAKFKIFPKEHEKVAETVSKTETEKG